MAWFIRFIADLYEALKGEYHADVEPVSVAQAPSPVAAIPTPPVPVKEVPDWFTPKGAYRATRVMCDEMGLTFAQKEIVCACIYQESQFDNKAVCLNRDRSGRVWSKDLGLVQVNNYFHCGKGKHFPSEQYVLDNPGEAVKWMIETMKKTGRLQPWVSYTSGAYRQWLSPSSPMRALKS